MSKWQPIGLALCFALAWLINRASRPSIPYEMPAGQRTLPTGSLTLEADGRKHELKLATVAFVEGELHPLFATPKPVRVLWLRSTEDGSGAEPDLELFADLEGAVPGADAQDLGFLRARELPVLAAAPGDDARSRIRLPGDSAARGVQSGVLRVDRTLAVSAAGEPARTRIEGSLSLALDGLSLAGTFNARVQR